MIYICDISNLEIEKENYKSKESKVGHLLLKYALKNEGINLNDYNLSYNLNGKPYIKDINYHFNISHSNNLVCLIIDDNECAVDIEIYDCNRNFDKIVNKYFNINDKEIYYSLDLDERNNFFYSIWVQIETHVKFLGLNMINAKNLEYQKYPFKIISDKLNNIYYLSSNKEKELVTILYTDLI